MEPTPDLVPESTSQPLPQLSPSIAPTPASNRGRRRILTTLKCEEICVLVAAGCAVEGAARHVGCAPKTIRREARRNPQFGAALHQAQMSAELNPLNAIRSAATRHWRAAAWLLERTNPQRFAPRGAEAIQPEELESFVAQMVAEIVWRLSKPAVYEPLLARIRIMVDKLDSDLWRRAEIRRRGSRRRP
jgi:hypothetical protein